MTATFDVFAPFDPGSVVAVQGDGGFVSAAELRAFSRQLGAYIIEQDPGWTLKSSVVVVCRDRPTLLATCLAVWELGGTIVFAPNQTAKTLRSVASQSRARVILVDETNLAQRLRRFGTKDTTVAALPKPEPAEDAPLRLKVDSEQLIASVYTSGTTGTHQRCDKTAAQLLGEAKMLAQLFGFGPKSVVGATVPSSHLYGLLFGLLVPFSSGGRFISELSLTDAETRTHEPITDLVLAPIHARALLEDGRIRHVSGVRTFCSGGQLDEPVARAFSQETRAELFDVLGSSESGGIGYRALPAERAYRPFPGVEVQADSDGAMLLRSRFLPDGGAAIHPMSDRVESEEDGKFVHLGRADGVIKIGGKRITLQEMRARALQLPGVTDAEVYVHQTPHLRGTELWLALASEDKSWSQRRVREALAEHFDRVLLPRRVRTFSSLPRGPMGKISTGAMHALMTQVPANRESLSAWVPRQTDKQSLELELRVPEKLPHFQGHFEEFPILPGSAQLTEFVLPAIEQAFPLAGALKCARRLKFSRAITPGSDIKLVLTSLASAPQDAGAPALLQLRFELFLRNSPPDSVAPISDEDVLASAGDLAFAIRTEAAPSKSSSEPV